LEGFFFFFFFWAVDVQGRLVVSPLQSVLCDRFLFFFLCPFSVRDIYAVPRPGLPDPVLTAATLCLTSPPSLVFLSRGVDQCTKAEDVYLSVRSGYPFLFPMLRDPLSRTSPPFPSPVLVSLIHHLSSPLRKFSPEKHGVARPVLPSFLYPVRSSRRSSP